MPRRSISSPLAGEGGGEGGKEMFTPTRTLPRQGEGDSYYFHGLCLPALYHARFRACR